MKLTKAEQALQHQANIISMMELMMNGDKSLGVALIRSMSSFVSLATGREPIAIKTKTCRHCGHEFKPNANRHVYCTTKCKSDAYTIKRTNVKVHVCICGKTFSTTGTAKVCSPECARERDLARGRARHKATRDARPPKICPVCGQFFKPNRSNIKYCTVDCRSLAERKRHQANWSQSSSGHKKTCPICQEEFFAKRGNVKYCSKLCSHRKYLLNKELQRNTPIDKECRYCGKTYQTTKHQQQTCSHECRLQHSRKYHREYKRRKNAEASTTV